MDDFNQTIQEGNLTRDPETKPAGQGKVCTFSIATNRSYKTDNGYEKETSFFDVTVWGKQAELCQAHLTKGRGVRVTGRLKQDRWEDADKKQRSRVLIVADRVEWKPERKTDGESAPVQEPPQSGAVDADDVF
jgi:single-strand DNA-binding protein